ncbi:hypothetical protein PMKS-000114 [Pichia membranifaciens]|uniref:Uncharacterized protein n=1 Tax=Pichia membranifaciens TaxID=4926 RepID=A0A1Q2YAU5_9ASCO|nr:hypothetical protein PMKS-000114 [Pichia membranifaciens]
MFYRQHIDHEDSDVITIDSGSINSNMSSPVLSPVVDENTVMNILHVDKDESVGHTRKSGTRGKFRELFRSLSWRNKTKPNTDGKGEAPQSDDADGETEEDAHIEIDNDAFSFSDSPVRNVSSNNTFDNLYDTSKPMLHLQANVSVDDNQESFINNQENAFLPQHKELPILPVTADSVLTPVNTESIKVQKTKPSKRSLSRKFSLFSIRSRPSTAPSMLDLTNASSYFADETLLTNWRMPKYQTATIITKRCPDHVEIKRDTKVESEIYLFLDSTDNSKTEKANRLNTKEKIQSNNIEKMLYFPYSKSFFESSCLHKGNALSLRNNEANLTLSSEQHFFIYNDNCEIKTLNTEFDVDSMKRSSALSVKSMQFQELIETHKKAALDDSNNLPNQVNPSLELDQSMDALNARGLIQIQAKNYNLEPSKVWKLWIDVVDKSKKSHRKFSVFTVISEYSQIIKLQKNYDTLLDYYIHDKNQQLYILKDEEIPIFHGKHKVKTYGEYVFVIPLASAKQVWRVMLHLLVSEKLSLNSSKYETIGICWRRYAYKKQYGYHLTFYVDDRVRFSYNGANLFHSDIRLMVPESVKHCFKRCKTVFPGDKEVHILEVL